jgi:serine/threonine-protein kinase RsbW
MTSAASPPGMAAQGNAGHGVAGHGVATLGTAPHEQVFPADASQVGAARGFLSAILADSPAADAAVLCLSELATNAITHSRSREPGGSFTVRVQASGQRLRVEVSDQGGPWHPREQASTDDPTGRGLLIVGQLAARWGCEGHSRAGWTVWFECETGQ